LKRPNLFPLLLLALLAFPLLAAAQDTAEETPVQMIELTGPAASLDAEFSGLAWYGDTLVLMTENPFLYADAGISGAFFALQRADILAYLDAEDPAPLEPVAVPIYGPDIPEAVSAFGVLFDGFEAITFVDAPNAFADDQVFLTIEAYTADEVMRGYLVWGTVIGDLEGIDLRLAESLELPSQSDIRNKSYEALLNLGDSIVALYEANGADVNPDAFGVRVDLATGETSPVPLDNLEFRLTDVTSLDADNRFWAINYYYPTDGFDFPEDEPLYAQYGRGASQVTSESEERLVEYEVTEDGLVLVERAPVQLLQEEGNKERNWEGIVRLDDRGLLIVTDRYPQTLLGLVALPAE
jgi:hypothetical protein